MYTVKSFLMYFCHIVSFVQVGHQRSSIITFYSLWTKLLLHKQSLLCSCWIWRTKESGSTSSMFFFCTSRVKCTAYKVVDAILAWLGLCHKWWTLNDFACLKKPFFFTKKDTTLTQPYINNDNDNLYKQ